jgi:hypothetical protein
VVTIFFNAILKNVSANIVKLTKIPHHKMLNHKRGENKIQVIPIVFIK